MQAGGYERGALVGDGGGTRLATWRRGTAEGAKQQWRDNRQRSSGQISTAFVNGPGRSYHVATSEGLEDIARMSDDEFETACCMVSLRPSDQPADTGTTMPSTTMPASGGDLLVRGAGLLCLAERADRRDVRLLTEAEWEAAALVGKKTHVAISCGVGNAVAMPLATTLMQHVAIRLRRTSAAPPDRFSRWKTPKD